MGHGPSFVYTKVYTSQTSESTIRVGHEISLLAGAWAYTKGGWPLAPWIGFALPAVALAWFATK